MQSFLAIIPRLARHWGLNPPTHIKHAYAKEKSTLQGGLDDDAAEFCRSRGRGRAFERAFFRTWRIGPCPEHRRRLAVANGAGDLADRDRRTEPEFPALCRQPEDHVRPELRAGKH